MPVQHTEHHEPSPDGSFPTDIITTISDEDRRALAGRPGALAEIGEFSHLAAWSLILLRTIERDGSYHGADDDQGHLLGIIAEIDRRLIPALEGIRDAAVRRHHQLGGSYGSLTAAMGVAKSTAQTRREALLAREASEAERWAVDGARIMPRAARGGTAAADPT